MTPKDSQHSNHEVDEVSLRALEARIDELIEACKDLADENQALRDQQTHLMAERATLIEKSELARSRVEAMIARLKAMEIGA
ncbi:MAG: TIGR02449 family protein [Gammaproteobacteria bacterium]|nr:TIGR02449 family protein [Gammaproteobacteria bacterium]